MQVWNLLLISTQRQHFSWKIRTDSGAGNKIEFLEKKVEDAEADLERLSALTCGIEKLEKRVQEIAQNNFILIHAVDDIEKATKVMKRI